MVVIPILLLVISAILYWYLSTPNRLPPGPSGLPIVGSIRDIWKAPELPSKLLEWAHQYGPIYKFYVGQKLCVVLADYEMIHQAFVMNGDIYAGRPKAHLRMMDELELGFVQSEGERWKVQRRFALSALRELGLGKSILEPHIKLELEQMLLEIEKYGGRAFDPITPLNNAAANVICALVFGRRFQYEDEDYKKLLGMLRFRSAEAKISVLPFYAIPTWVITLMKGTKTVKQTRAQGALLAAFLRSRIARSIEQFRARGDSEATSFVEAFCNEQTRNSGASDSSFTTRQLLGNVGNLFIAGSETIAYTLSWTIFYLSHHPSIQDEMYDEIRAQVGVDTLPSYADRTKLPLSQAIILEALRLGDVVPSGVVHRTLEPSELAGYQIPAGTLVIPLVTAVQKDKSTFPNPSRFDPSRFMKKDINANTDDRESRVIPFSIGKRACLGESLARMEIFLTITALVSRFQFSFDPDRPAPKLDEARVGNLRVPPEYKIRVKARST